ncbi:MAG: HupE/UreJ family protein [Pseudomonadota bacterium]
MNFLHQQQTVLRSLLLFVLVLIFPAANAHDALPLAVTITETLPGIYQFSMRGPPTLEAANIPALVWPDSCATLQQNNATAQTMRCEGELTGQQFSLQYPLFNPSLATFYRLNRLDGGATMAMLTPSEVFWTVPEAMTPFVVMKQYTLLGIEHIIGGYDHLLFVLGLLVIARSPRRILLTVTGFTLAHSISLSLSSLGFVQVPIAPVEATIALSIVFLAHEISRQQFDSLTYRFPLLVSFSFGLLHGLGFASALGEIGLAENEVLLSLLFFNLGVEAGQLLFIFTVMALVLVAVRALKWQPTTSHDTFRRRSDLLASYIIGIPAAYWLIDRVAQFGA